MKRQFRLLITVMAVMFALLASACQNTSSDIPAVAGSSAQDAQPTSEPAPSVVAESDLIAESEAFCDAVQEVVEYPLPPSGEPDQEFMRSVDPEIVTAATISHLAAADAVPANAPNIVANYFRAAAKSLDAMATLSDSELFADLESLAGLLVFISINATDMGSYVNTTCDLADWTAMAIAPAILLPPDPLVSPSPTLFCEALEALEEPVAAAGTSDVNVVLASEIASIFGELSAHLPADASFNTISFIRTNYGIFSGTIAETDDVMDILPILQNRGMRAVTSELSALCPNVTNFSEALALVTFRPVEPADNISEVFREANEELSRSLTGGGSPAISNMVDFSPTTVQSGDIESSVMTVRFTQSRVDGTGPEEGERFLEIDLLFSQTPDFTAGEIFLIDPDGTTFAATAQDLIPWFDTVRVDVDREITSLAGWTLQIGEATSEL